VQLDRFRGNALRHALVAVVAITCLSIAQPVLAQDQSEAERDFCADRPGKGTPSCVLDQGRWQVELGLIDGARQSDETTKTQALAAGDLFVRYGLTGRTELQLGLAAYERERVTDRTTGARETAEGSNDLSIGLRHSLRNPDGSGLSVALAGFITAPTGARAVRADGFEGGLVLPVSIPLDDDWSLSLSPELDWVSDADGDGRHATYAMTAGVGRGFGPWSLGVELWVARDDDPDAAVTQSTLDLTAVWSPAALPDAQLDFGLNFGLNDDSPDVEFGVGVARRF